MKLKRFDDVIDITSHQITISPFAFPLYYIKAVAFYELSQYPQARKILQYLIELNLEVFMF